jgi:hypothetical protein
LGRTAAGLIIDAGTASFGNSDRWTQAVERPVLVDSRQETTLAAIGGQAQAISCIVVLAL